MDGVLPDDNEVMIGGDDPEVEIEIVDDTPDQDKGRAKAEDLPEADDEPGEDELKSYSERVQKRIKDLNLRAHAERRSREQRERELGEAASALQRLRQERDQLAARLHEGEKVLVNEHRSRIESELSAVRAEYMRASEEGDVAKQMAAQEKLAALAALKQRASEYNPQFRPPQEDQRQQQARQPQAQPKVSEKATDWARKNKWFQVDDAMTKTAFALHNRMVSVEGIEPDTDLYYQNLDAEMRRRFPEKFGMGTSRTDNPRQTASAVAPVERTTTGPRKIRLTASQQALAKKLRISNEQYAREMLKLGGNNG